MYVAKGMYVGDATYSELATMLPYDLVRSNLLCFGSVCERLTLA